MLTHKNQQLFRSGDDDMSQNQMRHDAIFYLLIPMVNVKKNVSRKCILMTEYGKRTSTKRYTYLDNEF